MVLKESKPHSSLAFAKHKPTCSPLLCSTFPISQCQVSPHTATSRSKGASQHAARKSKTRRGILLQQPKLLAAIPGFTCGSLKMLKKSPAPPHLLRRHPHHSQDRKPSSAWVEDEPGKVTARELHLPMAQPNHPRWDLCNGLPPPALCQSP